MSTPAVPLIEVTDLHKRYGDFTALKGISFRIQKGEIVGFLGPNGAGKTTAMKIITGYIPATEGMVAIDGMSTFTHSLACRRRIGYLPEDVPLYDDMKVTAYLAYVCRLRDVPAADIAFRIDRMVTLCNLEPVKGKLIRQLSKGNRQRVGLAQALIHDPEILVLDEPTVGLDPKQVVHIREMISQLRHERTVILSTHILSEVEQMCDRVIIISEGAICLDRPLKGFDAGPAALDVVVQGPAAEVESHLRTLGDLARIQPGPGTLACRLTPHAGVTPGAVARAVVTRGWELTELTRRRESLESLFLEVTMR
ncbi:MAG: ATP-binding cassette domain-containing protein [Planctomycetota bacterium]